MVAHSSSIDKKNFSWLVNNIPGKLSIKIVEETTGNFMVSLTIPFTCPKQFRNGKLVPRTRNGKEVCLCRLTPKREAEKTHRFFSDLLLQLKPEKANK